MVTVPVNAGLRVQQSASPDGVGAGVGPALHRSKFMDHAHSLCCMQWLEIWVTGSFMQS